MAKNYTFEIVGATPLLMHRDNIEGAEEVKRWQKDPANKNKSVAGDDRSPPWVWTTYAYTDSDYVAMPQENIMAALSKAGAQFKLKGNTTYKSLTQSGIIMDEFHEFYSGPDRHRITLPELARLRELEFTDMTEEVAMYGFSLFVKRARIGQSKHIRVRPRFDDWAVRGHFTVTAEELDLSMLRNLFEMAGRIAGLCDWRPSSKTPGPFGQFALKSLEEA